MASSGLHSNGYSLARHVFFTRAGWALDRVVEPLPLPEMKAVDPQLYAELSREPEFICIRARR